MANLGKSPSRTAVLDFIFNSSQYGNLGLFIGAGFSKAVLNTERAVALSWGPLLEAVAEELCVDYASLREDGASFPAIASALCRCHADATGGSFKDSVSALKRSIATATAWYPAEPERSEFAAYLEALSPAWIVTTNYDPVLECLVSGRSVSLGPRDPLTSAKGVIPIFHLHGARTSPDDIIITQEDYVALFRPAEYRQIRLALTFKESTTCLLGYGLGDVNVLTALDWSTNVYESEQELYPHDVIQVYRKKSPASDPYRSKDGVVIVEVSEISEFCKEYTERATALIQESKLRQEQLRNIGELFAKAEPDSITRFIDEIDWRRRVLKVLAKFSVDLVRNFESFLEACFKETARRKSKNGAFQEYATDLHITLDLLTAFEYQRFPPALLPVAAKNLDRLVPYIGKKWGDSWAADNTWQERKDELKAEIVDELRAIARQNYLVSLSGFLEYM